MAVQLKPEQEQRLQQPAAQSGLTVDELLQRQLDSFLDYQEDLTMAVKRGDEDVAAGRVVEHDAVVARIDKLLQSR
jgi:predicted transcriptional regulator